MATAQSWEAGFPPEVAAALGADAELQLAIVEHKVPLPGGGFPSQCDVFALVHADGRDMAVAVEAKVEEPFGQTVSDWHAKPTAGKALRLAGICDWLGLTPGDVGDLRYQLLHRTAAAIAEARRFRRPVAAMVVQSFSLKATWHNDFVAFCDMFSAAERFEAGIETRLPDGMPLRLAWAKGDQKYLTEQA